MFFFLVGAALQTGLRSDHALAPRRAADDSAAQRVGRALDRNHGPAGKDCDSTNVRSSQARTLGGSRREEILDRTKRGLFVSLRSSMPQSFGRNLRCLWFVSSGQKVLGFPCLDFVSFICCEGSAAAWPQHRSSHSSDQVHKSKTKRSAAGFPPPLKEDVESHKSPLERLPLLPNQLQKSSSMMKKKWLSATQRVRSSRAAPQRRSIARQSTAEAPHCARRWLEQSMD